MANVKSVTDLPLAESAEGLNLIVNDGGSAKQIAASSVGAQADFNVTDESNPAYIKNKPSVAQADWAETDENSPAFVKNKPVEEWDLDIEIIGTYTKDSEGHGNMNFTYTINFIDAFENIKNKILSGVQPKCKVKVNTTGWGNTNSSLRYTESFNFMHAAYYPEVEGCPEGIRFSVHGNSTDPYIILLADDTIDEVGDEG